jgi:hypothetical protein
VFDNIFLGEQSLWLVIAFFYVFDNLKHLVGDKLVLHENWRFAWRISVPSDSLIFLNKQMTFLTLLPHTLTMPVAWLTAEPFSPARIRRADRLLRIARHRMLSFRCISVICFFGFFIEGPVLTYLNGLTYALLHVAPIYATGVAILLLALLVDRRFWQIDAAQITAAVLEAAVCPAYLANITHRMSWKYIRVDADGGAYGLLRCSARSHGNLKSTLRFALEELEQKLADDPQEQHRLFAYRKSIFL